MSSTFEDMPEDVNTFARAELANYDLDGVVAHYMASLEADNAATFFNDELVLAEPNGRLITVDNDGSTVETLTSGRRWDFTDLDENGDFDPSLANDKFDPRQVIHLFPTAGLFRCRGTLYWDGRILPDWTATQGGDFFSGRPIRDATDRDEELFEEVSMAWDLADEVEEYKEIAEYMDDVDDDIEFVKTFREENSLPPSTTASDLEKVFHDFAVSIRTMSKLLGTVYFGRRFMRPLDKPAIEYQRGVCLDLCQRFNQLTLDIEEERSRLPQILQEAQAQQAEALRQQEVAYFRSTVQELQTKFYDMYDALYLRARDGNQPAVPFPVTGHMPYGLVEAIHTTRLKDMFRDIDTRLYYTLQIIDTYHDPTTRTYLPMEADLLANLRSALDEHAPLRQEFERMCQEIAEESRWITAHRATLPGGRDQFYIQSSGMAPGAPPPWMGPMANMGRSQIRLPGETAERAPSVAAQREWWNSVFGDLMI